MRSGPTRNGPIACSAPGRTRSRVAPLRCSRTSSPSASSASRSCDRTPMNFGFNDEQQAIQATAKEMLAKRVPLSKVRAAAESGEYDDALWSEICELGWPGIAIPEEHGGQGLG